MTQPGLNRDLTYRLSIDPAGFDRGADKAERSASVLSRELTKLQAAQERVDAEVRKMGAGMTAAGAAIDRTEGQAGQLNRRIGESTARLRLLAQQLDAVTDELDRATLEKAFRGETAALARLKRIQKAVDDLGDEARETSRELAEVSVGVGVRAGGAFATLFSRSVASPASVALIGAVAAAGPIISATIAAAAVAGLASAGVAAGLAGAFQDPRVKAAAAGLGREVKEDFLDATQVFVEPTIDAMEELRQQWRAIRPEVQSTLDAAARLVDPLARGAGEFVARLLPGIRRAVTEAGPIIDVLADDLPRIGAAVGHIFSEWAEDAEQTAQALHDVLTATRVLVVATGEYLSYLGDIYNIWRNFINPLTLFSEQDRLVGQGQVGIVQELRGEVEQTTGVMRTHAEVLDHIASAYRDAFDQARSVEQAQIDWQRALDNLTGSVKEHGRSLDAGTEKGRANRGALLDLAEAAVNTRDANLAAGMSVGEARRRFEAQRAKILELAGALKLSADETQDLINKLLGIPTSRTSTVKVKFVSDTRGWSPPPKVAPGQYVAMQHGGMVSGPAGVDRVPAALTAGEFVSTVDSASRNRAALEAANMGAKLVPVSTGAVAGPAAATSAGAAAGAGIDERSMARAVARALTGVTIVIDDRSQGRIAVDADRLRRGG